MTPRFAAPWRRARRAMPHALMLAALVPACATPGVAQGQAEPAGDGLWRGFVDPPADARPMVRWWWFGPAVQPDEIEREIVAMRAGGFGGFEVQAVYPLEPDDALPGVRNTPFMSRPFLDSVAHAGRIARANGMRIDVTGGSGWPYGGPHIPLSQASAEIRMMRVPVPAGTTELALPRLAEGERALALKIGPAVEGRADRRLTDLRLPADGKLPLDASPAAREALLFVAGRTGQQVKRPSVGAEGYVIDHISPAAVANHLSTIGDPLLAAFAGQAPPDAVFSDSLEAYGASWTDDLPQEFRRRRGYDLLGHLPALFLDTADGKAIRFDYGLTLSELVDERYLQAIDRWAAGHGTKFRAQVYGIPPTTLSSNALVALPEGEGEPWRSFTSTRWATSGAHLYGKPVVSSETWTWLHSPSWAATPLDMKVEADRHFLQGVTQLIGHGWPYSPPGAQEPGWAFYAAAALNDHNPWYAVAMPGVNRYLQRASFMLRQGKPANSVAIYLPIEDAFAGLDPRRASANDQMAERVPAQLIEQVLDAGFGFDFIDAGAIRAGKLTQQVLVLPPLERIDPEAYAAIERWVRAGGKLLGVGALPTNAGGLRDADQAKAVARLSARLGRRVQAGIGVERLGTQLRAQAVPEVQFASANPALGFAHRTTADGEVYFVVNSGNVPVSTRARFAGERGGAQWWDPMTGTQWPAGSGDIAVELAPYQSLFLVAPAAAGQGGSPASALVSRAPLEGEWTLSVPGNADRRLPSPAAWTAQPGLLSFSGTATYRTSFTLGAEPGQCHALDFGSPAPRAGAPGERPQADLDAPVRDAARVIVNGRDVGSLWAPPYRLDITQALQAGRNTLEVQVANTALNALAARPQPDRRLLRLRYGERFTDQDLDRIAAQPSGLLGQVSLVTGSQGAGPCGGPAR